MTHFRRLAPAAASAFLALALAVPVAAQDASLAPPQATPNPVAMEVPTGDGTGVRLSTDLGDIVIGLFTESAPVAAENFRNLVASGFYDGLGFHRVAPGFVIQGGDPEGTGAGGPGYTISDEEVVGEYGRGIVAMARTPEPNSQGSQFFIVLDDQAKASLDVAGNYTIFGRVIEGMDVVDAIVARGPAADVIEDPVRIQAATIEQVQLPPEPTPAPPSAAQQAAEALAAQIPDSIAGIDLGDRVSFDSDVIRQGLSPELLATLQSLASENGADLAGLSVARAAGGDATVFATIVAASLPGVPAELMTDAFDQLVLGVVPGAVSTTETIGGRELTRIQPSPDTAPEQVAYRLASGEIVWYFMADAAHLEALVAALP